MEASALQAPALLASSRREPTTTIRRLRTEAMAVLRDEMRAPLMGLEALLDALAGSPMSPEVTERMHGHTRVLARQVSLLIEDLALVSAHDHRTIPMDVRVLDLDEQLAQCLETFPDMVIRVVGDKGLQVSADPLRLQQLCANLMRNALRRGGRPVTLQVSGRSQFATLRIADAGPRDGHELGLVEALVQAHGGITIHEVGGSFTLTLPRGERAYAVPTS